MSAPAKFYTAARRIKQLFGTNLDGTPLPIGPFRAGSVIAFASIVYLAVEPLSLVNNLQDALVVGLVAVAAGTVVEKMPSVGRNPALWFIDLIVLLTQGRTARVNGRPLRVPRPSRTRSTTSAGQEITEPAGPPDPAPSSAAAGGAKRAGARGGLGHLLAELDEGAHR